MFLEYFLKTCLEKWVLPRFQVQLCYTNPLISHVLQQGPCADSWLERALSGLLNFQQKRISLYECMCESLQFGDGIKVVSALILFRPLAA